MRKIVDNYELICQVGSGQYGKVFKAKHKELGTQFAVKCISLEKFQRIPKLSTFTQNEIQVLNKLNHPNIVTFIERLRTANNVYMVYEFCSGGTLENHIYEKKIKNEEAALVLFDQVVSAFREMAKYNVIHRDIKPSNILLHNGVIKIADFGFCKVIANHNEMCKTLVGSPVYMAPELQRGENYTDKVDIWSLGVLLYEMLYRKCPYEENNIPSLIKTIETKELRFPYKLEKKTEEFCRRVLDKNPKTRFSWTKLFEFYDIMREEKQQKSQPLNNIINNITNVPRTSYNVISSQDYSNGLQGYNQSSNMLNIQLSNDINGKNNNLILNKNYSTQNNNENFIQNNNIETNFSNNANKSGNRGLSNGNNNNLQSIDINLNSSKNGLYSPINTYTPQNVNMSNRNNNDSSPILPTSTIRNMYVSKNSRGGDENSVNKKASKYDDIPAIPKKLKELENSNHFRTSFQNNSSEQVKRKSCPTFLKRLLESKQKLSFKELEDLVKELPNTSNQYLDILSERCKINSLLFQIKEIIKSFGFTKDKEEAKNYSYKEILLMAIMKKIRYDIVKLQIKANNLDSCVYAHDNLSSIEEFRTLIQKEYNQFTSFYSNFIEQCVTQISNTEQDISDTDSKAFSTRLELKKQVDKPFDFDIEFFKEVLIGIVKETLALETNCLGEMTGSNNLKAFQKANLQLDCVMIEEINEGLLDHSKKPNEQKYLQAVNNQNSKDQECMVTGKLQLFNYVYCYNHDIINKPSRLKNNLLFNQSFLKIIK